MARKPSPDHPICPYCGAPHVVRHGSKGGRPRWVCRPCRRSFGLTNGTPDALVTLCLFEPNWMRPYPTLREEAAGLPEGRRYGQRSPAMAMGWTDPIWTWEEFLTFRMNHYKGSDYPRGGHAVLNFLPPGRRDRPAPSPRRSPPPGEAFLFSGP